jgi:beta-phosphoglucomutase-like phosphatase (HAD superfamily)
MSGSPHATPQIHAILFEPVGCLAEFPAEPFLDMAARFTGKKQSSRSGSRAYWHMLNVMESASPGMEALEIEAVERASVYEDVGPALAELRKLGIKLCIASSLSEAALARFVEKTGESFAVISSREKAGGIKQMPLLHALDRENLCS